MQELKPILILVHGYNSDGLYMHKLEPYLNDYQVIYFEYGKVSNLPVVGRLLNTVFNRYRIIDMANWLTDVIEGLHEAQPNTDIHIMAHSNGVPIAWLAAGKVNRLEEVVKSVSAINGALNAHTQFACTIFNYYCTTDYVIKYLARFRPGHLWGSFGSHPNKGAINMELNKFGVKKHSDFLNYLEAFMPIALKNIESAHYYE